MKGLKLLYENEQSIKNKVSKIKVILHNMISMLHAFRKFGLLKKTLTNNYAQRVSQLCLQ